MACFDIGLKIAEVQELWIKETLIHEGYGYLRDYASSRFFSLMYKNAKISLRYHNPFICMLYIGGRRVSTFKISLYWDKKGV